MPIGILFWVIMIVWFVFGLWSGRDIMKQGNYSPLGSALLEFILFGLLGWKVFGPVLQ